MPPGAFNCRTDRTAAVRSAAACRADTKPPPWFSLVSARLSIARHPALIPSVISNIQLGIARHPRARRLQRLPAAWRKRGPGRAPEGQAICDHDDAGPGAGGHQSGHSLRRGGKGKMSLQSTEENRAAGRGAAPPRPPAARMKKRPRGPPFRPPEGLAGRGGAPRGPRAAAPGSAGRGTEASRSETPPRRLPARPAACPVRRG